MSFLKRTTGVRKSPLQQWNVSWPLSSTALRPTSERITAGHTSSPTFHLVQDVSWPLSSPTFYLVQDVSWPLSSPTFHLVQDVSWPLSSPTFHLVQDVSWPLSSTALRPTSERITAGHTTSPTFHLVQDVSWPLSSTALRPASERITAGHTPSLTFYLVQFGHDRFTHGLHLLSLVIKLLLLSQVDGIQPGDHLIEIIANGFNVAQNVARISTSRKKTSCYALT